MKTEIPKTERKTVLQNAIIASRKIKLYSVTMLVRSGINSGSKKIASGMTFDLVAKEFMMGAKYVVDAKHILKMFEDSHPEFIQKLFDIRNVGKEMMCPKTEEIESKRVQLLYAMNKEQDHLAEKASLEENKKLPYQDKSNMNPWKRKSLEVIVQSRKKRKITPFIPHFPSKDTGSESSVHKPSDSEILVEGDSYSPDTEENDDDVAPAQIVQDPAFTEILDDNTETSSSSDEESETEPTTSTEKVTEKMVQNLVQQESNNLCVGINSSIQEDMDNYKMQMEKRKKEISLINDESVDKYKKGMENQDKNFTQSFKLL